MPHQFDPAGAASFPECCCPGVSVAYLYSLYDALVSISVPSDKARAVVDAMERDMGATLATKQDLELHRLATKQDLELLRQATKQDLELHRKETKQDLELHRKETRQDFELHRKETKQDIELLRQELAGVHRELTHEIGSQTLRMTVRFGSMLFLGLGLTIAVLRLWSA